MNNQFNGSRKQIDNWKLCNTSRLYYPTSMFVDGMDMCIHSWCKTSNLDLTKKDYTETEEKILALISKTRKMHNNCVDANCIYNKIELMSRHKTLNTDMIEKLNLASINTKYKIYNNNPTIDFDNALLILRDINNN